MAIPPHVSAVGPSAVTLVTQTRVSPSDDEEFARWQEQVPPLTTVRTAYPAEPFLPVIHPPIEMASFGPRGRLYLDRWIDFPAISLGTLL